MREHSFVVGLTVALGVVLAALAGETIAVPMNFTVIDVPGADGTSPYGINNVGQIVGAEGGHGFVYADGRFSRIDVPVPIIPLRLG